jgi:sialic acid synthase SpsE
MDKKTMNQPKIIAEIGCNHKGDMDIAKELIMTAAVYCKADVAKFQKRDNKILLTPEEYNAPHPNPYNSYGKTYGEHPVFLSKKVLICKFVLQIQYPIPKLNIQYYILCTTVAVDDVVQ